MATATATVTIVEPGVYTAGLRPDGSHPHEAAVNAAVDLAYSVMRDVLDFIDRRLEALSPADFLALAAVAQSEPAIASLGLDPEESATFRYLGQQCALAVPRNSTEAWDLANRPAAK